MRGSRILRSGLRRRASAAPEIAELPVTVPVNELESLYRKKYEAIKEVLHKQFSEEDVKLLDKLAADFSEDAPGLTPCWRSRCELKRQCEIKGLRKRGLLQRTVGKSISHVRGDLASP